VEAVGGGWLTAPEPAELRWIRVTDPSAATGCRNSALGLAARLQFPPARADDLALAVTEAATNLAKHAREGLMMLRGRAGPGGDAGAGGVIELVTLDAGPGIADVDAALRDGTSTAGTLGIGLGAIRRLADFSDLYAPPGHGTVLTARFLARRPAAPPGRPRWAGLVRAIIGEAEAGDSYVAWRDGDAVTALLCDGLGHGPLAAAAARAAVAAAREAPGEPPAALLRRAHERMSRTRGGALAIVRATAGAASFAGLGNIAGWIMSGDGRQGMISVPGIAGHQAHRMRQYEYEVPPGAVVVLHSDGLSSRWSARDLPGLAGRDPLVIAAALLREAGVHRDDASVLAIRPGPSGPPGAP
jgi:anti-sigma regulatory factor (Ser/Thr protein kinase)